MALIMASPAPQRPGRDGANRPGNTDEPNATSRFLEPLHGPRKAFGVVFTWSQVIFVAVLGFCVSPWASPPVALALGLVLAQTVGNPFLARTRALTPKLLQYSVVGLGFGMNAHAAVAAGREGLWFTVASIVGTLGLGFVLGRGLGLGRRVSHLIACGTAICGGSAIAAVGPVLGAKNEEMSVALGTVFVLNAVALMLFPPIGHALAMTQHQFGLWCAIAIHDTSSVVGAAAAYGSQALEVATTVKLARALWIIPVALGTAALFKQKEVKVKLPYFILGFVAAMLFNTWVPTAQPVGQVLVRLAKIGLTVTLFFIGAGLSVSVVKAVGVRPLVLGALLWLVVSGASLLAIMRVG